MPSCFFQWSAAKGRFIARDLTADGFFYLWKVFRALVRSFMQCFN
jgi:hypothetical protein